LLRFFNRRTAYFQPEEIAAFYKTGRGSFKLRSKYIFDKKNNCIEITEIPYTTTIEAIIEKIIELVKTGKIRENSRYQRRDRPNGP
jgi:DNA gyrase subunit A